MQKLKKALIIEKNHDNIYSLNGSDTPQCDHTSESPLNLYQQ